MSKRALITGITGQDASFLAELLLEKGYKVFGLKRRTSTSTLSLRRIQHIIDDIEIIDGDLADNGSLVEAIIKSQPDEVYNLAAQSFVKSSFTIPEFTGDITGLSVCRLLEAIFQNKKDARFYQASSSEIFGNSPPPQKEDSLFHPRSPYGCAKLYAYWMTRNYRERPDDHKLFACNGLLFNHETLSANTPVIYRNKKGKIDIASIGQVAREHSRLNETEIKYQESEIIYPLEIWDANGWTKVTYASCYPHKGDKKPRIINTKASCFTATSSHCVIMDAGEKREEKEVGKIELKDKINLIDYPEVSAYSDLTEKESELLGIICGDGHVSVGRSGIYVTSKSLDFKEYVGLLWTEISNEGYSLSSTRSGFTGKEVGRVYLKNSTNWVSNFDIYCDEYSIFGDRLKRVPCQVLNSKPDVMLAFLKGYNLADGLKSGHGDYELKNFKTNSPILAAGLCFLVSKTTKQDFNITVEESTKWREKTHYYSINLNSNSEHCQNKKNNIWKIKTIDELIPQGLSQREMARRTGVSRSLIRKIQNKTVEIRHQLSVEDNEVKKIIDYDDYKGWFYDLTTESGTFHCGVGRGHVHNSPRRGPEFVTQKIAQSVASIKLGYSRELHLGNMDAKRDWGHAKDYVRAMWMILQHDVPDDYVVSTGEAHSVKEFVELAFQRAGLDWQDYVSVDQAFFRPTEVDYLLGDCSKIRNTLGWKPEITFENLVNEMVDYAIEHPEDWLKKAHAQSIA